MKTAKETGCYVHAMNSRTWKNEFSERETNSVIHYLGPARFQAVPDSVRRQVQRIRQLLNKQLTISVRFCNYYLKHWKLRVLSCNTSQPMYWDNPSLCRYNSPSNSMKGRHTNLPNITRSFRPKLPVRRLYEIAAYSRYWSRKTAHKIYWEKRSKPDYYTQKTPTSTAILSAHYHNEQGRAPAYRHAAVELTSRLALLPKRQLWRQVDSIRWLTPCASEWVSKGI